MYQTSVKPRHSCSELGAHLHVNGYSKCSLCFHYYDCVHVVDDVCFWCAKEQDK